ncbi:XRE family transcriptional regulator [Glutamicibacter sp. NPDC087344]|uniref:XRE family transcriptional regulator n=1 Tax=Glutamicibacter sp. NPDC087344 TaxID=3363994 RepID=UPI0037F766F5
MLEPTRITLARHAAGYSLVDLARLLQVRESTIRHYESCGAPQRLAPVLAEALDCAPGYFRRPPAQGIEKERIFFRAPRRMGRAQKNACAALGRTGAELYQLITAKYTLPDTEVPDYTGFGAQAASAQLRLDWNLGCGPVPDLLHVLESRGVRVLSAASGPTFSFWEDSQAFIFLAAGDVASQRYQLAHELGHLVLHSALGTDGQAAEYEAEQFAARLLLPAHSLQARISDTLQLPQLLDLQELFGAPARLILGHARECGMLADEPYRWLVQELALERAPGAGLLTSRVFSLVFPSLRGEDRLDAARMADTLGLPARTLHELTFGHAFMVVPGLKDAMVLRAEGHLRALP